MGNEVVPFGKYKGQPVEILRADEDYCNWLMGQEWFRSKFGNIYQTIINYGGEPQESPEHNEFQASFLEDARCFQLARLLYPNHPFDRAAAEGKAARATYPAAAGAYAWAAERSLSVRALYEEFKAHLEPYFEGPWIGGRKFEDGGWDVVYAVAPTSLMLAVNSLPGCTCGECDHEADCPGRSTCRGGEGGMGYHCEHVHRRERFTPTLEWLSALSDITRRQKASYGWYEICDGHCARACPWTDKKKVAWLLGDADDERCYQPSVPGVVRVECKPELGDDFPAVLRQVTSYKYGRGDRRCVVARRANFEKVTWEQVVAMFAASGIVLLREAQLLTPQEV